MKLSEIKVDAAAVEEGEWVDTIPEMGDLKLKVRGIPNKAFRNLQAKLVAALPRNKRVGGQVDADAMDEIVSVCLLETVLLDWQGVVGDDDAPVPYDRDTARTLLTDPDFARFRTAVLWAGNVVGEAVACDQADDEKNS